MKEKINHRAIVLFDGYCNLCSWSVQFIIKRDKKGYFDFAALQSGNVKKYLQQFNIPENFESSLVLIEGSSVYFKSGAALRIAKKLKGLWPLFYVFVIIPKPLRDLIYLFIAKNRFKWFGKRESCYIPGNSITDTFNNNTDHEIY